MITNEEIRLCPTAATAAAKWWRRALEHPRYDNGDNSVMGAIVMMMAMMANQEKSPEVLDQFEVELASDLEKRLEDCSDYGVSLGVDYNPDQILWSAAERTGMDWRENSSWPWKTHMWVKSNEITVSAGYRAPTEVIWSAPAESAN